MVAKKSTKKTAKKSAKKAVKQAAKKTASTSAKKKVARNATSAKKKPAATKQPVAAPATTSPRKPGPSEPALRLKRRFARKANNALKAVAAASAASAPLLPEFRQDPIARWFDDPLQASNEYATVRDLIEGQARAHASRTFLIYEETGHEYSFADLERETSVNVNLFRALGAEAGARIGVLDANTPEFIFLYTGCMKGAYTSAPLNYHLKAPELQFCLANSESELLLVSAEFWQEIEKCLQGADGVEPGRLNFLKAIVLIGEPPIAFAHDVLTSLEAYTQATKSRAPGSPPPVLSFEALRDQLSDRIPASHPRPAPDTQAEIIYTSGTTGKPKGVILRHHQFLTDGKYIARWYRMTPDTRMGMVLPLFHVNAEVVTTMTPLVAGASVVMFKKFSASRFWPAVERYRINIVSVVPTILTILTGQEANLCGATAAHELARPRTGGLPPALERFTTAAQREHTPAFSERRLGELRAEGAACAHDISCLWTIICGAAPLPAEVQLAFERTFLIPITEGYGLSETTCYSTFNPIEGWRKIATIGVEVGNQVNIFGAKNRSEPANTMGEIVIRGENVMQEYFKRPEANAEAFSGGWFHSGDVGEIDSDGFVRIRDRVKDMIIRGGENIYPREIDEVLYTHPAVENAATIGVPDPKYGEEVASFIVLKAGQSGSGPMAEALKAEITDYCRARLANYKVPRSITFIDEIPKGPTGKLLRRVLREMVKG